MDDQAFAAAKAAIDRDLQFADPAAPLFLSIDLYRAFVKNNLISNEIIRDAAGIPTGLTGCYGSHHLGALPSLPCDGFMIANADTDIVEKMQSEIGSSEGRPEGSDPASDD